MNAMFRPLPICALIVCACAPSTASPPTPTVPTVEPSPPAATSEGPAPASKETEVVAVPERPPEPLPSDVELARELVETLAQLPVTTSVGSSVANASPLRGPGPSGRSTEQIRKTIQSIVPTVKRCFESALTRNPNVSGKIVLHLEIDTAGKVTQAEVRPGLDATMDGCIQAAAMRAHFGPGPVATVSYPFVFKRH